MAYNKIDFSSICGVQPDCLYFELEDSRLRGALDDILKDIPEQKIVRTWQSKYNSYVEYDYEPFCSEGFIIKTKVYNIPEYIMHWLQYRFNERLNAIGMLENMYLMDGVKKNADKRKKN